VDHLPPLGFVADRLIGANISANNEHAGEHKQDSDSYDGFHLCVIPQVSHWRCGAHQRAVTVLFASFEWRAVGRCCDRRLSTALSITRPINSSGFTQALHRSPKGLGRLVHIHWPDVADSVDTAFCGAASGGSSMPPYSSVKLPADLPRAILQTPRKKASKVMSCVIYAP
jgi:hypothetical protein